MKGIAFAVFLTATCLGISASHAQLPSFELQINRFTLSFGYR